MGYAGYSPGMRVADKLTPLEQALRSMPVDQGLKTLELLEKLTRNVVRSPSEEKFRRIRLANKAIAEAVVGVPGALDALHTMGWVDVPCEDEGPCLALPADIRFAFETEVVGIIEAKDWYKKEQENAARRSRRDARDAEDPARRALMEQAAMDRAEKAAEEPARTSKANRLGDGPNIMRASDIGIGASKGGG